MKKRGPEYSNTSCPACSDSDRIFLQIYIGHRLFPDLGARLLTREKVWVFLCARGDIRPNIETQMGGKWSSPGGRPRSPERRYAGETLYSREMSRRSTQLYNSHSECTRACARGGYMGGYMCNADKVSLFLLLPFAFSFLVLFPSTQKRKKKNPPSSSSFSSAPLSSSPLSPPQANRRASSVEPSSSSSSPLPTRKDGGGGKRALLW